MSRRTVLVISDIHYASAAEQQRGEYYLQGVSSPSARFLLKTYRHFLWMRDAFAHNRLLDDFLERAGTPDLVVANGDYSCNSAFVGVSDDAACLSARECLEKLRGKFGPQFRATLGDHELGKMSLVGGLGGMRLASWQRARTDLQVQPFWEVALGRYVLMGIASSLVGLPVYERETLPGEREEWHRLRELHLAEIRRAFTALRPEHIVVLFCHDPTALPFLWREDAVRAKLSQVAQTIIGHLHSRLILRTSGLLAGMPVIRFLGHTPRRLSAALKEARHWRPFNVRLCPAVAGIELLKDGGYCSLELEVEGRRPVRFQFHALQR